MILSSGSELITPKIYAAQIVNEHADASIDNKLSEVERNHILKILEYTSWRVSGKKGAALILGLKPTTLEARMKKLGISRPT